MTRELAENNLPARHRRAQQQQHRPALHFAYDRVMREQQRDQRDEKDGEAGQADDDHVERLYAYATGWRAAEKGQREGEQS